MLLQLLMVLKTASGNEQPYYTRPRRSAEILDPQHQRIAVDLDSELRRHEDASSMEFMVRKTVKRTSGNHQSYRTRSRRSAEILSPDDQKTVVDLHNQLRRQEGANNMDFMVRKWKTVEVFPDFLVISTVMQWTMN